jgi:hypothetical protein
MGLVSSRTESGEWGGPSGVGGGGGGQTQRELNGCLVVLIA